MIQWVFVASMVASTVMAEEWVELDGAGIQQALSARVLQYAAAQQDFFASGKTLYDAGQPSWGYWRVQGNQYCSQWPPTDGWACYDVAVNGLDVRFTGRGGDVSIGRYIDLN